MKNQLPYLFEKELIIFEIMHCDLKKIAPKYLCYIGACYKRYKESQWYESKLGVLSTDI